MREEIELNFDEGILNMTIPITGMTPSATGYDVKRQALGKALSMLKSAISRLETAKVDTDKDGYVDIVFD